MLVTVGGGGKLSPAVAFAQNHSTKKGREKSLHIIQRQDTINTLLFGSWRRLDNNHINKVLRAATPGGFPLLAAPVVSVPDFFKCTREKCL